MSARMFGPVAAFEWRYQLKSPVFWVGCLIFFLLTFGATTIDQIQIGSRGNVHINSPYAILQTLGIMGVFAVFIVVAMVAGTVLRDDETGFAPILRSTRVGKGAYLTGRFTGAIAAAWLVLASVPLAIAIGSAMPWLDPEKIGPFVPSHYLYALVVFGLPTLLITGASFFALATATRSMMWTYVGAVGLLVLFFITRGLLRDVQHDTVAALTDPFGLTALRIATKYWTAADRNTRMPEITGLLLANRVLWTGVALALFATAWWRFRFEVRGSRASPKAAAPRSAPTARRETLPMPRSDAAARRAQFMALARFDMAFVFRSPTFFVLLIIGVINAGGSAWYTGDWYGASNIPVTRLMVQALQGAFTLMPIIIAIYYGGELVWRDRERRMHEIVDATAAPDWAHLVPKIAAITLVLVASSLVAVLTGMLVQVLKGYTQFQLGAYLLWFAWPTVVVAVQLAVLSVFVQVMVPQKFIGWGLMLLYLVASVALSSAGFEHNLYNYGGTPPVPLSDMNGMARFWIGQSWFHLYWSAFATLLAVGAYAFWRRGVVSPLRLRLPGARRRLRGGALIIGGVALATVLGSGGFIFWNTNLLNDYLPTAQREARLADAERELLPFETLPMPRITAVTLAVQLYPKEVKAVTQGSYRLENRSGRVISELHLNWNEHMQLDEVTLAGASLLKDYSPWRYRSYRLQPAMQPGEVRILSFKTTLQERGFPNSAPFNRLVDNGSFIDNSSISPGIGISRDGFLKDRAKRRKYGLPADLRPPALEDEHGRDRSVLRADSDWVDADITLTTDADQVPIAPGYTVSDTTANGRRTVHFKPDAPINHFFSIQSGRYTIARDQVTVAGKPIDLAVYHHAGHEQNVPRMMAAMKQSLALFSEQFSPYQFRQARILEFPSYADFAQSFANTIPYSENLGFLTQLGDPDKIDVVTYVTAHEIAHQWWGHQLVPSHQQGATMLIESFAQYSALLVMERLYGKEQMRRFLKYELDRYLRARGGEVVEELPLARVENQSYIHYQKGSLVLYWLKEVVGEDVVNRSMAKLLQQYAFKAAPYANTQDFLRILRAEAGPQHQALITDLFEKITLLDVKVSQAKAVKRADGKYEVSLVVEAKKFYADGKGKETEAPLAEPFDLGVFSAEPGRPGYTAASVLSFTQQQIRTGTQTLRLVVDRPPSWVGVDPYNKRIDRNSEDNLSRIDGPANP
ncbi:ABC transporter permease/M1 family aminopeptidase [Roseateles amylovorans]|uniref:M1 family aminopeptidase n=1 Tax=Roseateles amylovorans TaxID=2978473 RepID=A0ABY6B157_9BURK|nr:M1 family aminopeptidase [Roseateles amylovorans]UXH77719.1 M1 family aminopeptidase [Roseateles amylovorans]